MIFAYEDRSVQPPLNYRVGETHDIADDLAKTLINKGVAEPATSTKKSGDQSA